jgi:Fic family protein
MYIHQRKKWPHFNWDDKAILKLLAETRNAQGVILGKMSQLGFDLQNQAVLQTITLDILKNSEIEGNFLNDEEVRSSVARKLGLDYNKDVFPSRDVEGVVEMMMDATQNHKELLTKDRLFDWHAALFPTGRSGMYKITVDEWRKDDKGPMQVVSGPMGKEKVHFEAPESLLIDKEMEQFIKWFNGEKNIDDILAAAIAHLWFITIHPFDDGNGRITRAITEMQLARSDKNGQRFYSLSNQILKERKAYYEILEKSQRGDLNITDWVLWFLDCLKKAIEYSDVMLSEVLRKARFWNLHKETVLNERQRKIINKLFDGFFGKLTTSKWAKICKCSTDTALRDIQDLERKGVLQKEPGGGRSTSYKLILPE